MLGPEVGFDELGSQTEVLGIIDKAGVLYRLYTELRLVFPVYEIREAQDAGGVGCSGITAELAHHSALQGFRLFL